MRLIDFGVPDEYQPLNRGEAFKQFYENGDSVTWWNPVMWNYQFWCLMGLESKYWYPSHDEVSTLLMGGEL